MLLQVQKKQEIIEGYFLVVVSSFSEPRTKLIKDQTRPVVDCVLTPTGVSKGYDPITTEFVVPDKKHFDGSKFHDLIKAADPDFDIDALEEYDTDILLKKRLIIKVEKGIGKKHEFANVVAFKSRHAKVKVVAYETDDTTSIKKRSKKSSHKE